MHPQQRFHAFPQGVVLPANLFQIGVALLSLLLTRKPLRCADRAPMKSKNQWLFPGEVCTPLRVTVISC